jgi:Uma2 family endonuclease
MTEFTPIEPSEPTRVSASEYFRLVEMGVLEEDDRVELLEGVIVAMTPPNPPHATATMKATFALARSIGDRATVRTQCSFIASAWSVPEPDVAVVPGDVDDYCESHPDRALLLVEVADSSVKQDRLSKSRIYAAAGIPEYWIVNLRESVVEVMRDPDPATALYRNTLICVTGDELELVALPGACVAVADLLPNRR